MPRWELGGTGSTVGVGAAVPCCRSKGKGQPTLGAARWELQELLEAEELPIPSLGWAGLTALLRAQAEPGTVPAAHGPSLVGSPTWGQPREPDGGQRRAPRLEGGEERLGELGLLSLDRTRNPQVTALEGSWQLQAAWQETTKLPVCEEKGGSENPKDRVLQAELVPGSPVAWLGLARLWLPTSSWQDRAEPAPRSVTQPWVSACESGPENHRGIIFSAQLADRAEAHSWHTKVSQEEEARQ